ncbi:MAG TPA: Mur ligase family protein [Gaiellaceae bacterium]|nr:Mur ligase family protein [Gaiellaceae bacterium]
MRSADNLAWLVSLSPWPEEFGVGRMRELLRRVGSPERRFGAIHVVGSNGKTTTARFAEALLLAEGVETGTYTSPHVVSWGERVRVGGEEVDLEAALARVRAEAEALRATQFEALTAAAFAAFADEGVEVAVVEAGLGGRHDATNVLDAPVVVLTNVSLEHADVLGDTREAIAAEKLAVVAPGSLVVLGEHEWEAAARAAGAAGVGVVAGSSSALAHAAVESLLGRAVDPAPLEAVVVPGRLERVGEAPLEVWDGAHNLAGVGYLLTRVPRADWVLVVSILADKDAAGMLAALSALGSRLVVTASSSPRALSADALAALARPFFPHVETVVEPLRALARGRELAGEEGALLVTGSLYLLADLASVRPSCLPWQASAKG